MADQEDDWTKNLSDQEIREVKEQIAQIKAQEDGGEVVGH